MVPSKGQQDRGARRPPANLSIFIDGLERALLLESVHVDIMAKIKEAAANFIRKYESETPIIPTFGY